MAVKTVTAVVNGQTIPLTLNTTNSRWEGTATAPTKSSYNQSGHYYPVKINAADQAGNTASADAAHATLGKSLQLVAKEKVKPTLTITGPGASSTLINNKPAITWQVRDADSGVNPDTISIKIDSGAPVTGSAIIKAAVTGGYDCSYTPATSLADGTHTVTVNASDYDGNAATAASVTFKVDTVPPVLNVTAPANGLITNQAACTVTGTTNDVTSSPVTVKIKLNGTDVGPVTVGANGVFSKALTLRAGANTIVITATDGAGKSSEVTRTVTLDTTPPVIKAVTLTPNPVDCGATYTISVEVTD